MRGGDVAEGAAEGAAARGRDIRGAIFMLLNAACLVVGVAIIRMLGRDLHSTYGPTADTGGLAKNGGVVIYAPNPLPGPGHLPSTERP